MKKLLINSEIWDLSVICAKVLYGKGITGLKNLKKKDLIRISGLEEINQIDENSLENDDANFDYFVALTNFQLACICKGIEI